MVTPIPASIPPFEALRKILPLVKNLRKYGISARETVFLSKEFVQIGSDSFNVPFIYITNTRGNLDNVWPSDAILGMGRGWDNTDPTDENAIYGILSALPKNVLTVYFDR